MRRARQTQSGWRPLTLALTLACVSLPAWLVLLAWLVLVAWPNLIRVPSDRESES